MCINNLNFSLCSQVKNFKKYKTAILMFNSIGDYCQLSSRLVDGVDIMT